MSEPSGRDAFLAQVAELHERVATAHLRVSCGRCGADVGQRCVRVTGTDNRKPLKHSHPARLRADGIPDR